jgi:hypothetical protein
MSRRSRAAVVRFEALAELAERIRAAHRALNDSLNASLDRAFAFGELLIEAKRKVPRGKWLPWLAGHCQIAERTAQAYMRCAKNRPAIEAQIRNGLRIGFADALAALEKPKLERAEKDRAAADEEPTKRKRRQATGRGLIDPTQPPDGIVYDSSCDLNEQLVMTNDGRLIDRPIGKPAQADDQQHDVDDADEETPEADDDAEQPEAEAGSAERYMADAGTTPTPAASSGYDALVGAWWSASSQDRQRFLRHIGAALDGSIPGFLDKRPAPVADVTHGAQESSS